MHPSPSLPTSSARPWYRFAWIHRTSVTIPRYACLRIEPTQLWRNDTPEIDAKLLQTIELAEKTKELTRVTQSLLLIYFSPRFPFTTEKLQHFKIGSLIKLLKGKLRLKRLELHANSEGTKSGWITPLNVSWRRELWYSVAANLCALTPHTITLGTHSRTAASFGLLLVPIHQSNVLNILWPTVPIFQMKCAMEENEKSFPFVCDLRWYCLQLLPAMVMRSRKSLNLKINDKMAMLFSHSFTLILFTNR